MKVRGDNKKKLVDAYCEAHLAATKAEKTKKKLRAEILEMIDPTIVLQTDNYAVSYSKTPFETLDLEAIRRDMGEAWCKKYTTNGTRETLKVTPLVQAEVE